MIVMICFYNFAAFSNRTSYIYHILIVLYLFYNSDYFIKTNFITTSSSKEALTLYNC